LRATPAVLGSVVKKIAVPEWLRWLKAVQTGQEKLKDEARLGARDFGRWHNNGDEFCRRGRAMRRWQRQGKRIASTASRFIGGTWLPGAPAPAWTSHTGSCVPVHVKAATQGGSRWWSRWARSSSVHYSALTVHV
jgi:hypothetical protein